MPSSNHFSQHPMYTLYWKSGGGAVLIRLFSPSNIIKNRHKLCPSLITNFCFCLKASNQMLFNNIGFPTKGAHAICWHIYKEKEKVVLLFYLPKLRRWILDTGSFTNSECTLFWKGKQVYTRLFGLWPSIQGGHAICLPKYKWEENVFFL